MSEVIAVLAVSVESILQGEEQGTRPAQEVASIFGTSLPEEMVE
jgi:hypothetical protein